MRILALDLGKFKSVFCDYRSDTAEHAFGTIATTPQALHDLLAERQPERLVIEVCTASGWVHDLGVALGIAVEVANPNTEGWRWQRVKRKTDRDDALKLAKLSAMGQLPTVHVPGAGVRQWRSLIAYRHKLVARRSAIRNSVRAILDAQGLTLPRGSSGWTREALAYLQGLARPLEACDGESLWRGQLHLELAAHAALAPLVETAEAKLDALAEADARVKRLRTIPGVGPRAAELVVAWIDDPRRFTRGRELGAYAGLVPSQRQSGEADRSGRITRRGPGLLRKLLVEIAWGMRRHNGPVAKLFEALCRGHKSRRKQAAVAVARRLLVWCWAMLRDGKDWDPARLAAT